MYWIAQFGGPLNPIDAARLKSRGIDVLFPTVANGFYVRASAIALCSEANRSGFPRLLGWARLAADDKLLPDLHARAESLGAESAGAQLHLRAVFFPGADTNGVADAVRAAGGHVSASGPGWIDVRGPPRRSFISAIAALDEVYALGIARAPLKPCDLASANASNITVCQQAPLNLSGNGITVMVRDQGVAFAHPDFGSRLSFAPEVVGQAVQLHTTHVAGIIGGSGLADPTQHAMGMAVNCKMVNYDIDGDQAAEPLDALNTYGALLSNHSYGVETGWDQGAFVDNQATFGTYSTFAQSWDSIVRSNGLIMVKAVGNARDQTGPGHPHNGFLAADGDYYTTIDESSTSKNVISVGAAVAGVQAGVPAAATSVLSSSSSGPCTDGRLCPELIADGANIVSCNTSAAPGNQYTTLSGTSMACAVVTGATALFLERYQQVFPAAPCPPHYVRALYAQTATDMGRPGPDYLHGFGMLDLNAAINLFDLDNGSNKLLVNSSVTATVPERFFRLTSDGVQTIKVTLCWTDDSGDVLAQQAIVNQLNLRLVRVSDQTTFLPFVLNKNQPDLPATMGVNSVDTIQQLVLQAPQAGNYLVAVRAASLATDTNFTLASSHALTEDLAPIAVIKASSTSGTSPLSVTFDATGSSDPDGSIAQYFWDFGDGATAAGALTVHVYASGSFTATLQVIDDQGASTTATVLIGVDNKPPVVSASVSPVSGTPPLTVLCSSLGSFDPDGTIVHYAWDFGDGTAAAGPQVTHTYAAPGLYFVTLSATDDGGAVTRTTTPLLAGNVLTVGSSSFTLNFQRLGSDRFMLSSNSVNVPKNLNPAGLTGSLRLGQALYTFALDAKGRFNAAPVSGTLNCARSQLKLNLRNTNLGGALTAAKATNRNAANELVLVPIAFSLSNGFVAGSIGIHYNYTATFGKQGSGRFAK